MTDPDTRLAARAALRAARERIADPERWCQGETARDNTGADVSAKNPRAVCWCADGALLAITGGTYTSDRTAFGPALRALDTAAKNLYPQNFNIAKVNDKLGHAAVLRCYDLAIAWLEGELAFDGVMTPL